MQSQPETIFRRVWSIDGDGPWPKWLLMGNVIGQESLGWTNVGFKQLSLRQLLLNAWSRRL
jgi:hypothetical protein